MNILVTGANGLLGRNLVEILSKEHKIYALIRNKNKLNFAINKNIYLIENDLVNIDLGVLPKDVDVVYYLAQSDRFREFPEGVDDIITVNILAPNILAKWSIKNGVRKFIYTSSGGVYGNISEPAKEYFVINANEKIGFYLHSKLSAEMLLRNFANLFETFVILRPFFMYGKGQNKSMLIPRLIENVKNEKEIILNGKEGIKINPIYISDAANAISKVINLQGEFIINIAGNEIISLKQLCYLIGKLVNKEPIFKINNIKQNDLIADIEFMKKHLYSPIVNLETGIKKIIEDTT